MFLLNFYQYYTTGSATGGNLLQTDHNAAAGTKISI